jgi:ribose transport system ATP-binding protein
VAEESEKSMQTNPHLVDVRLRVSNLSKTFDSATVLKRAGISVNAGEIHALLGANGSGKSTLVKLITGVYVPDPGAEIEVNEVATSGHYSPDDAYQLGIRVVHQEAPLIDTLTLAELTALHNGFPTAFRTFIRARALARETRRILARLNIEVDPDTTASRLSAAERAMFALALALSDLEAGKRLLVLDEATASLPVNEASRFLSAVSEAAGAGAGVLLVTHRLAEVLELSHRVTVLRNGEVVFSGATGDCTHDSLVDEIVGPRRAELVEAESRAVLHTARFAPERMSDAGGHGAANGRATVDPLLSVQDLSGEVVEQCSLELAAGEILGICGIFGSGVSELGRLVAGVEHRTAGSIRVAGKELPENAQPHHALRLGVVYVPADRLREGGIGALSMRENVALPAFNSYWMKPGRESDDVAHVVDTFAVQPPDPEYKFGALSGGNQQKVILGKWALLRPRVWVLDDPTAGVDPGAREEIFGVLRGLAQEGVGIIFISSEPEQLARMASRVLVMKSGHISGELQGNDVTERAISSASL